MDSKANHGSDGFEKQNIDVDPTNNSKFQYNQIESLPSQTDRNNTIRDKDNTASDAHK